MKLVFLDHTHVPNVTENGAWTLAGFTMIIFFFATIHCPLIYINNFFLTSLPKLSTPN